MKYDDTHVTEAQLADLNGNDYEMAVMADESGLRPRYLFSNVATWLPNPNAKPWRRLVVHVPDINQRGLGDRLLAAMKVELHDVPF